MIELGRQFAAYCARIGIDPPPTRPSLGALGPMMRAHQLRVPFENIDVVLGELPSLDPGEQFAKIVDGGRGGYCHELNGLFSSMLEALGYRVRRWMARVRYRNPTPLPPLGHQLLAVELEGRTWIVDVGFGGPSPLEPLALPDVGEPAVAGVFQIRRVAADRVELWGVDAEDEILIYDYRLVDYEPVDFRYANFFVARHPDSLFVNNLIVARPREDGHTWRLFNHRLVDVEFGLRPRVVRELDRSLGVAKFSRQLDALLSEYFELELDASVRDATARWLIERSDVSASW